MSSVNRTGNHMKKQAEQPFGTASSRSNPQEGVSSLGDGVREASEQAKSTASSVIDTAKEMASSVVESAGNVGAVIGQAAEDAATRLGKAGSAVAGSVESGGRFLKEEGISLTQDITDVIKRNPLPAVFIALAVGCGAGYLLACSNKR